MNNKTTPSLQDRVDELEVYSANLIGFIKEGLEEARTPRSADDYANEAIKIINLHKVDALSIYHDKIIEKAAVACEDQADVSVGEYAIFKKDGCEMCAEQIRKLKLKRL